MQLVHKLLINYKAETQVASQSHLFYKINKWLADDPCIYKTGFMNKHLFIVLIVQYVNAFIFFNKP